MRDQLKRLEDLQKHDAQLKELNEALQGIPAKIRSTENDLARVEGLLATERAQLADAKKYLLEQRGVLEMENHQLQNAKSKLSQAKNPREQNAAQREIEQTREMATSRETEIKKLVEAVDSKEKVLAERAAEVEALRQAIEKDKDAAKARSGEMESRIKVLLGERDQIATGIRQEVLKRYAVIRGRKGTAVSSVSNGTCTACNMNLPPQLFNLLKRGTTIEVCPYCHRIIFWEEIMKDGGDAQATPGKTDVGNGKDQPAARAD